MDWLLTGLVKVNLIF